MKHKIVLIFPVTRPPSQNKDTFVGRMPFSLLYLARNLTPDYEVEIHDERIKSFDLPKLLKSTEDALCVGVSVFTGYQIHAGLELSRKVREHNKSVPIVWGGWHPTLEPHMTLSEKVIDYIVTGQGEQTFRELVEYFEDVAARKSNGVVHERETVAVGHAVGATPTSHEASDVDHMMDAYPKLRRELDEILAVGYRSGDEVKLRGPRPLVSSDIFAPLDFSLVDASEFLCKTEFSERSTGLFASHGCPQACTFCSVYKVYNKRWFKRDVDRVIEEIRDLKERCGLDSIVFDDDNFFVFKGYTIKLLQGIIDAKLNITWAANAHSSSFLKLVDEPFMQLIKDSGCKQLLIGAESGNDKILKEIVNKAAKVSDTYEFVKLLKKWDIMPVLSTMVGFPHGDGDGTDYLDTTNMIARCKNIHPKGKSMVFFFTPYPGTPLYDYALANGFKPPTTLEGWATYSLTGFASPWVTEKVRRYVRNFNCFYTYYYHPGAVFWSRNPLKILAKSVLWAICAVRFRLVYFKHQFDAEIMFRLLTLLDKWKIVDMKLRPWVDF